jgi:hypothetical protein
MPTKASWRQENQWPVTCCGIGDAALGLRSVAMGSSRAPTLIVARQIVTVAAQARLANRRDVTLVNICSQ